MLWITLTSGCYAFVFQQPISKGDICLIGQWEIAFANAHYSCSTNKMAAGDERTCNRFSSQEKN